MVLLVSYRKCRSCEPSELVDFYQPTADHPETHTLLRMQLTALASGVLLLISVAGPAASQGTRLDLPDCLAAAMASNRELLQAREDIQQAEGNRDVVRARLMPHLSLTAEYDALRTELRGQTDDQVASRLRFSQRLFEFGPHAPQEIQLRAELRQAVYGYEEKVYETLARVWEVFHLILLQDQQIALRTASRDNFQVILRRQTERAEKQLASEEDKLEAELNVLDEDVQINKLRRQQFSNKMELLRLVGRPIGTDVQIEGQADTFSLSQDEAVALALRNDVQIALREEQLAEQRRVVGEISWEYSPDISLRAGVEDGRRSAGMTVDRQNKTWGVDMTSDFEVVEDEDLGERREDTQWFTHVEASIPILAGGSRLGREALEKARLRQREEDLRDLRAGVELRVRQAYQSMLEADEEQRLQQQRVGIARRRLEINQALKEKALADEAKLEQVRTQFFNAQVSLFNNQSTYIRRQAELRRLMGYVE